LNSSEQLEISKIVNQSITQNKAKRGRPSKAEQAARLAQGSSTPSGMNSPTTHLSGATAPIANQGALASLSETEIELARGQLAQLSALTAMVLGSERFIFPKEFLDQNQKLMALTLKIYAPAATSERSAPFMLAFNVSSFGFFAWMQMREDRKAKEKSETAPIVTAASVNQSQNQTLDDSPPLVTVLGH